jgi:argininosuccinate synthase
MRNLDIADTRDKLFTYHRAGLLGTPQGTSLPELMEEATSTAESEHTEAPKR